MTEWEIRIVREAVAIHNQRQPKRYRVKYEVDTASIAIKRDRQYLQDHAVIVLLQSTIESWGVDAIVDLLTDWANNAAQFHW